MNDHCREVTKKIERWLELSTPEKDVVNDHAEGCERCSRALASIEPVLDALDRSAKAYRQLSYAGPIPSRPEPQPALAGWWPYLSKAGWATALAATIGFLVWFGVKPPASMNMDGRPSMVGTLRIPSMPSLGQSLRAMPMSPGALGRHIPKPKFPTGLSLQRHIRMPQKPAPPDGDPRKHISKCQQYHAYMS